MGAKKMAEREGFEPSVDCSTAVFKTAALNHSTISPHSGMFSNITLQIGNFKLFYPDLFAFSEESWYLFIQKTEP